MKKKYLSLILPIVAFIMELLPNGIKMQFLTPPGESPIIKTTSYFDLLPFGYGNVTPFVTAILTCILIAAAIVFVIKESPKVRSIAKYIALASTIISVCPVFLGSYTIISGIISALLLCETLYLFLKK